MTRCSSASAADDSSADAAPGGGASVPDASACAFVPTPPARSDTAWLVVLIIWILALRVLLVGTLPVLYKEAYFYEWSRNPALGYLEHPPMVAWIIALFSSSAQGPATVWELRAGALLIGAVTIALLWLCGWQLFRDRWIANWSLLIGLALPVLHIPGVVMLPDTPLLLFCLLFLVFAHRATESSSQIQWVLCGVLMGLALLSKLMAVLPLAATVVYLVVSPERRRWFRNPGPYLAAGACALVFLPFVIWNAQHRWATFSFQLWERHLDEFGFSVGKIAEFAFEQLANTSVFLFLPLFACLLAYPSRLPHAWRSPYRFLWLQAVTVLLFFLAVACVSETHPHWTLLAWPPAAICLAVRFRADPHRFATRRLRANVGWSLVLLFVLCAAWAVFSDWLRGADTAAIPGRWEAKLAKAQVTLFGRDRLDRELSLRLAALPDEQAILLTDSYRLGSMMAFHHGTLKVINIVPLLETRHEKGGAQRYYAPYRQLVGRGGLFFRDAKMGAGKEQLAFLFERVERMPPIELRCNDAVVARYLVYRVQRLRSTAIEAFEKRTTPYCWWKAARQPKPASQESR